MFKKPSQRAYRHIKTIPLLFSLFMLPSFTFAEPQTITRQTFIDAQIEQLKAAEKRQAQLTARNIALLKQTLSEQEFEVMMAEEEAAEKAEHRRMSECLGISENAFEAYRAQFDTDFQIELVQTCSMSLPETISLNNGGWQDNADLTNFQSCAEAELAKITSIPEQRLAACSYESNQPPANQQRQ